MNIQTSNADKHGTSNDPVWQFLAEYPLSEFLSDHDKGGEHTAGLLFQTMRELGIPPEYLEDINITLAGFAKEALVHFEQRSIELPGRIRVFCQKKMIGDANSAKTSGPYDANQAMEHAQIIHPSGTKMNEGWGYYVIERDRDLASNPGKESCRVVELYLYKEGE